MNKDFFHEPKRSNVASLWRRLVALVIDHVPVVSAVFIVVLPLIIMRERTTDVLEVMVSGLMIMVALIGGVYLFIRDGFNGHGLGKRIMGLQVVKMENGQPVGFGTSALRYLMFRMLSVIEIIIFFIQPNHRGVGDWLGQSMVINTHEK